MINQGNLNKALRIMGFKECSPSIMEKKYHDDSVIRVDFDNKEIIYPESEGLIVNERQTCNFNENENFVVLECVDRLLSKGYFAESIELEPKWKLGRGAKGGRADILVKGRDNRAILIIECKTYGNEFTKEWNRMQTETSQLISYAWQERDVSFICLYTSNLSEKEDRIIFQNYVIFIRDNEQRLEELESSKPLSYATAKNADELYLTWKNTYNLDYKTKGIFESDIQPYNLGKKKYTIDDLKIIEFKDIQPKYHEFATILRQHNVSGKENAFDKLVNLFLCKIVDETNNPDDLQFNWKGISFDTPFELQDRLQKLYKEGMAKFLHEEITYIDNNQINHAFRLFKNDPDATKATIMDYFKQLKFFTNNDFAFIEVHNERLFYQNAEILLKIVRMLEDMKLTSESENQFLGDLFEGFLDQGIKQSEGQYFTPLPIVKFIIFSLPIDNLLNEKQETLRVVDYACGAGHFLNEYALYVKDCVPDSKLHDLHASIYGIEKEYRLSKVAKVSSFMYGQDNVKIVYGDALSNLEDKGIVNNSFDILISNPPYSVKGFIETLNEEDRKKYSLMEEIEVKSYPTNNSIETFFIERAEQLLKDDGLCAIIVPTTVLSNSNRVYERTREIILQSFDIIAISEFGSQTFGQTNTNTIVLFLRKRKTRPKISEHYRNRVEAWFNKDFSKDKVFDDEILFERYLLNQGYDSIEYKKFMQGNLSEELLSTDIFMTYKSDWEKSTEVRNLKKKAFFKNSDDDLKKTILEDSLLKYITNIEKEKLYYYMLVSSQGNPVIISKAPTKNADQKKFLGYEWSKAKGNEGIKFYGKKSTDIIESDSLEADDERILENIMSIDNIDTPLYSPYSINDESKINYYIRSNFAGKKCAIPKTLEEYLTILDLSDMLDFSMGTFDKKISTVRQSSIVIESIYELKKLKQIVEPIGGLWTGEKPPFIKTKVIRNTNFTDIGTIDTSDIALIDAELGAFNRRRLEKGDIIIEKSGGSETQAVGRVVYFDLDTDENYSFSNFTARLRVIDENVNSKYLFYMLKYIYQQDEIFHYQTGSSGLKNLNMKKYLEISIPIPEKGIQNEIVTKCEKIDEEFETIRKEISQYQMEIKELFNSYEIGVRENINEVGGTLS